MTSRLVEKLMFDQSYDYIRRNQLIFPQQSAFKKLYSVLACLLKSANDWYVNIDKGNALCKSLSILNRLLIQWIIKTCLAN